MLAVAGLVDGAAISRLDRVLSPGERARLPGFRRDADRLGYLAAHGLVRYALSAHAPAVAPEAWTFRTGPRGRPEVDAPAEHRVLRFNLTHTRGTVACVVTDGVPCGIDAEPVDGAADVDRLAGGVLTPAERSRLDRLDRLDDAARRAEFFRYWTLKEAYVKARGDGITLPLDQCEFDLSREPIRARFDPPLEDDPRAWWFEQWHDGGAVVALALRTPDRPAIRRNPTSSWCRP